MFKYRLPPAGTDPAEGGSISVLVIALLASNLLLLFA